MIVGGTLRMLRDLELRSAILGPAGHSALLAQIASSQEELRARLEGRSTPGR